MPVHSQFLIMTAVSYRIVGEGGGSGGGAGAEDDDVDCVALKVQSVERRGAVIIKVRQFGWCCHLPLHRIVLDRIMGLLSGV